jgi:pilus assembly protein CpaE
MIKHSSGLSVLASSDKYSAAQPSEESIAKLVTVTRQDFDYVVVDAGLGTALANKGLIDNATVVYLVTQVSIPELRNANRLIAEFFGGNCNRLEVVLNRYAPRVTGIDEDSVTKALTTPAKWRVPSDYPAVKRAQNTATALADADSPVSRVIRQMARTACGLPATQKKKGFLF